MKVLFINDKNHDYLSESLFHGLRSLLGNDCIDYVRYDQLYKDTFEKEKHRLRGNGFTLYGLLEDTEYLIEHRKLSVHSLIKQADLIIFTDIINQFGIYKSIKNKNRVAILDGGDHTQLIPYENLKGNWNINPSIFLGNFSDSLYFKREFLDYDALFKFKIIKWTNTFRLKKILKSLRTISFSIPKEKITYDVFKNKTFNAHIVDEELLALFPKSSSDYLFTTEKSYYEDLKASKFGITSKRAGWDCLRHYELAANGAVLCFRNLLDKTNGCAPHGLIPNLNCLSYSDPEILLKQIHNMSKEVYTNLQKENYKWIEKNTTLERAKEFLLNFS